MDLFHAIKLAALATYLSMQEGVLLEPPKFLMPRPVMKQHNPLHPGNFIKRVYIEAENLDPSVIAKKLQISADEFNHLMNGSLNVSPDLASKLSNVLGRTSESWLLMQRNFDVWNLKQNIE